MMTTEEILNFIRSRKIAVVASVDEEGFPNQKAMFAPRRIDGRTQFYFTTNTSSVKVAQFRCNPHASVYFYDQGKIVYTGVLLKGTMEVLEDAASKESIWQPTDVMYYPQGVTDPDYCVLKFTAMKGRYYRNLEKGDFTLE